MNINTLTAMRALEHISMIVSAHFWTRFRRQPMGAIGDQIRDLHPNPARLCPLYLKLFKFLAGTKLRDEPAGLLSSTRPSLAAIFGISIFRKDFRIRPTLASGRCD